MEKACFSLLFIMVTVTICVQARSISKRQSDSQGLWTIGSTGNYRLPRCLPYHHSICNQFGTHTLSFNPARPALNSKDVEEHQYNTLDYLLSEFERYYGNRIQDQNCHQDIILFLCLSYFPTCTPQYYQPASAEEVFNHVVFPCQETCEAIHESSCTALVANATGGVGWARHLQCNHSIQPNLKELDIFIPSESKPEGRLCTNNLGGGNSESGSTTESGEEPTSDSTQAPTAPSCPPCNHKGKYRKSCTANSFKRNCFEFVVHVNITGKRVSDKDCSVVYTVDVVNEEDYAILSKKNVSIQNSHIDECRRAPTMPQSTEIMTDWNENCINCPDMKIGEEYMIAGYCIQGEDGNIMFKMYCDDCMVSSWIPKYGKRMPKWVIETNSYRQGPRRKSTSCTNFC